MTVNPVSPAVQDLAQWLFEHEVVAGGSCEKKMHGAFRVCDKLRNPLSTLAGIAGYKSLLNRALTLAKADVHGLDAYQVNAQGYLEIPEWAEPKQNPEGAEPKQNIDEKINGELSIVAHMLGLLFIFIGEHLTLKLVRDVWPNAPFEEKAGAEEKR